MAKRIKLNPLIDTTPRVSSSAALEGNVNYELALIPTDELTSVDWTDIVKALQELVEVDVKDFEVTSPLGTRLDYLDLLSEVSEAKGWLSPERSILVALEAPSNRQGQVELE